MADHSAIEWTDATWNPIVGCSVVSPGCTNCYAMKLAGTRLKHHWSRKGLTRDSKAGPVWNGEVRLNEEWLDQPLRWRRPRMIFVCAHGDLFHENAPEEWINKVFAVMARAPQHTFQVLTKRSSRMRAYASARWPAALPNVWLGVSAEDQQRADERVPDLLATPAAVRFVSAEPLLGPIDFNDIPWPADRPRFPATDDISDGRSALWPVGDSRLDWIIVGGESGDGARPMHPAWARAIRDQCSAAGVPFFFKQWGEHLPLTQAKHDQASGAVLICDDAHDLVAYVLKVGKHRAGRLLDGVEHNDMPGAPA